MATYKVIQDIEAEDKLLGPLTLRQFIYAAITIVIGFIIFKTLGSGVWYVALGLAPPMFFFGLLAAPFGHDQSSEVWMLAKVRFWIKPRIRIWDQDGVNDLVTITAPKPPPNLTNGLSQPEVQSRLEALATTIDSRGWVVKDLGYDPFATNQTDRLVDESQTLKEASPVDMSQVVDVMDENTNPTAQNFDKLMAAAEQSHRQQIEASMQKAIQKPGDKSKTKTQLEEEAQKPAPDFWFMREDHSPTEPGISIFDNPAVVAPGSRDLDLPYQPTDEEQKIINRAKDEQAQPLPIMYHLARLDDVEQPEPEPEPAALKQPTPSNIAMSSLDVKLPPIVTKKTPDTSSYSTPNTGPPITAQTDIMKKKIPSLPFNNDLNVETIAREANRETVKVDTLGDEVVINLHYKGTS
ncbi:MAG TPA: PrgI family protein [Candidatus Saccharimonadales bacterium]|nr:PrgI family protein [Candidatus Saccharimonadales bacterium]